MIHVTIDINGTAIYIASAFRTNPPKETQPKKGELCTYKLDDGTTITQKYGDAIGLSIKILKHKRKELRKNPDVPMAEYKCQCGHTAQFAMFAGDPLEELPCEKCHRTMTLHGQTHPMTSSGDD